MTAQPRKTVLHYLGYDDDHGGIVSVVRSLAAVSAYDCVLGVNAGCVQHRAPPLPTVEFPRLNGEKIGIRQVGPTRRVAQRVAAWLAADSGRVFHGHSRAGLLVGIWLARAGERRVAVSVHCYGRQRWFYRWAAKALGARLFWLSPAMREYYGVTGAGWSQCIPGGVLPAAGGGPRPVPGRLRLGGIGSLVRWKRWDLVLEALSRLAEATRRRISFVHVGGAAADSASQRYAAELRRLTTQLGLERSVRWCGPEPSAQRILGEIDVLVVAAENEPFSIALQEALAAGVPVLAADSGGTTDAIRAGENGWLFRSGDAAALARTLERLVEGAQVWPDPAVVQRTAVTAASVAEQWGAIYARL